MIRKLPPLQSGTKTKLEIADFQGMNNTDHPSILQPNIPINLQNSYFQGGILEKRQGFTLFGSQMASGTFATIEETFTNFAYRDTSTSAMLPFQLPVALGLGPTTAIWSNVDGKATLGGSAGHWNTTQNILQSIGYDTGSASQTYGGYNVDYEANGGSLLIEFADSADNITFGSWTADITSLTARYIKFRITIYGSKGASPVINSLTIEYAGVNVLSEHSWTRNDSTKYLLAVGGSSIYVFDDVTPLAIGSCTAIKHTSTGFQNFLILTNGTDNVKRFNGKQTFNASCPGSDKTVTGSGTTWDTVGADDELAPGARIKFTGFSTWYTVDTVTDNTHLELTANGPDTSGAISTSSYSIVDLGGTPSKGKYVTTHKRRVFITGNSTNPTRVYFCDVDDATTWNASVNWFDVNTNDGTVSTGFASFTNVLQIHKSDSSGTKKYVVGVYWDNEQSYSWEVLTNQCAAVSQWGIAVSPNYAYFIDRGGLFKTSGISFIKIDNSISNTTANFNQQYIQNACAIYFVQNSTEFILFSVPVESNLNDKILICDVEKLQNNKPCWGIMSGMFASCFAVYSYLYTPELYFGDQQSTSQVFIWNKGTSDNGSAIDWIVDTNEFNLKEYFNKKAFKHLYAFFESTGNYEVTAYYSLNGGQTWTALSETLSTEEDDNADVFKRWTLPSLRGSSVKFRFKNNAKDQNIKMVRIGLISIDKGLRRI